jgi:hypothetical protein
MEEIPVIRLRQFLQSKRIQCVNRSQIHFNIQAIQSNHFRLNSVANLLDSLSLFRVEISKFYHYRLQFLLFAVVGVSPARHLFAAMDALTLRAFSLPDFPLLGIPTP